jgi:hypothetical protein
MEEISSARYSEDILTFFAVIRIVIDVSRIVWFFGAHHSRPFIGTDSSGQIVEADIHDPGYWSVLLMDDRHFLLSTSL